MEAWVECIKIASSQLGRREIKSKTQNNKVQNPGEQKIHKMLSDLVIYCQSVPFDFEGLWYFGRFPFARSDQYFESKNNGFKKRNHLKMVGSDLEKIILILEFC